MSQVLILNSQGHPMQWMRWQDAVTAKAKGLVVWEMGEADFTRYGGNSRLTGEQSSITYSTIMAVRGNHFPSRTTPALTNVNLFGRDRNICAYCTHSFMSSKLTCDHIVPKAKGGKDTWMNCVTACKKCNNMKGDTLLEHSGLKLAYVPYIPTREEALILKNRHILGDQMEFLQKMLPKHSRLLAA